MTGKNRWKMIWVNLSKYQSFLNNHHGRCWTMKTDVMAGPSFQEAHNVIRNQTCKGIIIVIVQGDLNFQSIL